MLPDTGIDDVKKQRNAEYAKHINDPVLSSLKIEGIRLLFNHALCIIFTRYRVPNTQHFRYPLRRVCGCQKVHILILTFITNFRRHLNNRIHLESSPKSKLHENVKNGNSIPLQAWTGPEGSRRLRQQNFKTIGT
jgi:hypothetical protein